MSKTRPLLGQTPSQTVGPYFAYGLTPTHDGYPWQSLAGPILVDETTPGQRIRIEGRVFDGAGTPVTDALVEMLHADHLGHYAGSKTRQQEAVHSGFTGFGRCGTGVDPAGLFHFETIKPGVATPGEAPHVTLALFMRGLLLHVFTRLYFADEAESNAADPVLRAVPPERRKTLIAKLAAPGLYRFDIHMQGSDETVFFDL
jgi:protocatechuate 3,4-dioxygenase, alpha subunit